MGARNMHSEFEKTAKAGKSPFLFPFPYHLKQILRLSITRRSPKPIGMHLRDTKKTN